MRTDRCPKCGSRTVAVEHREQLETGVRVLVVCRACYVSWQVFQAAPDRRPAAYANLARSILRRPVGEVGGTPSTPSAPPTGIAPISLPEQQTEPLQPTTRTTDNETEQR